MGLGHVPQDPLRSEGSGAHVQGREYRGTPSDRPVDLSRNARGRWGEDQAARWYCAHGYTVIDRNWRAPGGVLDLVARRGNLITFVEVKTRATDAYGDPALAVTPRKQMRLRRLGAAWLAANAVHGVEVRFDVVSVLGVRVRVIEGAF